MELWDTIAGGFEAGCLAPRSRMLRAICTNLTSLITMHAPLTRFGLLPISWGARIVQMNSLDVNTMESASRYCEYFANGDK